MKKYKNLYEEEKQRHEEALQRYQEDHMDKTQIINLHKKCNKKARKVSQPKKASESPGSPGLIDDPSKEEQKLKKASRPNYGKKTTTKAGKKVKKISQPKKASKSPEFIDSSDEEEEGLPKDDKGKKTLLGVKEEAQSFLIFRRIVKI